MAKVGESAELKVVVSRELLATAVGNPGVEAFATPFLVQWFEAAAIAVLGDGLSDEEVSVGSQIEVNHRAATPVGMTVHVTAELTEFDGRRALFRLNARDEAEEIADGTHVRFVLNRARFAARLASKRPETP
jgi:predicted thioesterase